MTEKLYSDFWIWAITKFPLAPEWDMLKGYLPDGYDTMDTDTLVQRPVEDLTVEELNRVYRVYTDACEGIDID